MEATVSKCGVRMQSQMALTPPAARNPGLEGAPRMGNSRCISLQQNCGQDWWARLGVHMSALPSILSTWAASGEGPSTCLLKLLPAPWLPAALCHSKQDLGIPESKGWSGCKSHSLELLASGFDLFCVSLCLGH